jgi:hypothetical protein
MASRIKPDVLQALQDWKAGKPVKSLELGHVHRMKDVPGFSPTIDASEHLHRDQDRAHAYLFHLIELFSLNGVTEDHDAFLAACDEYEQTFDWGELPVKEADVFNEERNGAESLAWKALRFGWARAIEGHKDSLYIEVRKESPQLTADR